MDMSCAIVRFQKAIAIRRVDACACQGNHAKQQDQKIIIRSIG
jgi:hypothetical protein